MFSENGRSCIFSRMTWTADIANGSLCRDFWLSFREPKAQRVRERICRSAFSRGNEKSPEPDLFRALKKIWCRGTESNCPHGDFQSPALPTELPRHDEKFRIGRGRVWQEKNAVFAGFFLFLWKKRRRNREADAAFLSTGDLRLSSGLLKDADCR